MIPAFRIITRQVEIEIKQQNIDDLKISAMSPVPILVRTIT